MPIKFGESVRERNGKIKHDYMSGKSTAELIEYFNKDNAKPKLRDKVKKELLKRGTVNFTR